MIRYGRVVQRFQLLLKDFKIAFIFSAPGMINAMQMTHGIRMESLYTGISISSFARLKYTSW